MEISDNQTLPMSNPTNYDIPCQEYVNEEGELDTAKIGNLIYPSDQKKRELKYKKKAWMLEQRLDMVTSSFNDLQETNHYLQLESM